MAKNIVMEKVDIDRLIYDIKQNGRNLNSVCRMAGLSSTYISCIKSRRNKISRVALISICSNAELNYRDYIITKLGEEVEEDNVHVLIRKLSAIEEKLASIMREFGIED